MTSLIAPNKIITDINVRESDKKRIHIPAECLERSHTALRTIASALEGNRSKYLWVFDQPFPLPRFLLHHTNLFHPETEMDYVQI